MLQEILDIEFTMVKEHCRSSTLLPALGQPVDPALRLIHELVVGLITNLLSLLVS